MSNMIGPLSLDEKQALRLGRTLRRISRTTRDLMRELHIEDEAVRIPRRKRKPKAASPDKV